MQRRALLLVQIGRALPGDHTLALLVFVDALNSVGEKLVCYQSKQWMGKRRAFSARIGHSRRLS